MKNIALYTILLLSIFTSGCGGSSSVSLEEFSVSSYNPQYAKGFEIMKSKRGESSMLKIYNPWQGSSDDEQMLLFISRNQEKPPVGFKGQVVKAPIRRVVCMSSSHVAMMQSIDEIRRVVGVSGINYISNKHINEHKLCGEVRDVGYDTNMNFELILAIQPDIVLLYGVSGENTIVTGKLAELGIPYLYIGEYAEELPLGKSEWLIAIAEMVNKQVHGKKVFDGISRRYNALKESVKSDVSKPKVMLNTPYQDVWFMPSNRNYMVRLIEDAGGKYIYEGDNSNSSMPIDLEEAYKLAQEADVWLNVGLVNSMSELKQQNSKFASMPAVVSNRVYNSNGRQSLGGGSDFWESGTVTPDIVLSDLITILNDTVSSDNLYYYKQLR